MGFSPSEKHFTTASFFSDIIDTTSGTFSESLTISGTPVVGRAPYINLQDRKTSGTSGGTFTSGAWRTRVLNTIVADDTGEVTLSSNQFTLPAGTYQIYAIAPAYNCSRNSTRLRNITDGSNTLIGTGAYTVDTTANVTGIATVTGKFTISASKTFELQHRCATTSEDDGFGANMGGGFAVDTEIYSVVEVWKVA